MTTSHMKMLLAALVSVAQRLRVLRKAYCDGSIPDRIATQALPVSVAVKCHPAHRFSRREQWQRYRNLIKGPVLPGRARREPDP